MLRTIITSGARRGILELFFHHPRDSYYLRKIVRICSLEVNAVKRELDILLNGKVLVRERKQNKVWYSLNTSYTFYEDFLRLFAKTTPLAQGIYDNITKIGNVRFAVLSRSFADRTPVSEDEIYLLLVGVIVVPELVGVIKSAEHDFGREINYTVMTEDEFAFRKKNNDPFIWKFLKQPKIMLIGQEEKLII